MLFQESFAEYPSVSFGEQAALTFKFRTLEPTSLILYTADEPKVKLHRFLVFLGLSCLHHDNNKLMFC